ncbi:MAG: DUF1822 family protein [Symploca sp. SIO2C1]|nr:DUF1822 family protein [Symploca sp. SIO2C1]
MTNITTKDCLAFSVPLTIEAHYRAQRFHSQQSNLEQAKQIYLNTLAVYAVNFYLRCLGIETDLEASDSWNPIMQILANTADLVIKDIGKLECRSVLPGEEICRLPPEVCSNRIGYVAVELNQQLTEATLLGFIPTVTAEVISISKLRSLEEMLEKLNPQELLPLSQWLQNAFGSGWEAIETLLSLSQEELAFDFRSGSQALHFINRTPTTTNLSQNSAIVGVKRGKLLHLEKSGEQVALLVGLVPQAATTMDISVEVYPTGGQTYLPRELQLMLLDQEGEAVMQAQARSTKSIQLEFSGEVGEHFSVKVALGDVSITEPFII